MQGRVLNEGIANVQSTNGLGDLLEHLLQIVVAMSSWAFSRVTTLLRSSARAVGMGSVQIEKMRAPTLSCQAVGSDGGRSPLCSSVNSAACTHSLKSMSVRLGTCTGSFEPGDKTGLRL